MEDFDEERFEVLEDFLGEIVVDEIVEDVEAGLCGHLELPFVFYFFLDVLEISFYKFDKLGGEIFDEID